MIVLLSVGLLLKSIFKIFFYFSSKKIEGFDLLFCETILDDGFKHFSVVNHKIVKLSCLIRHSDLFKARISANAFALYER